MGRKNESDREINHLGMTRGILIVFLLFVSIQWSCQPDNQQKGEDVLQQDANRKVAGQKVILTVTGAIKPIELGITLTHEHVMSNFGAEPTLVPDYPKQQLLEQVLPYLRKIDSLGVKTVFDCTTAYFGRDASLLRELSEKSGVQIITNTGIYGAANDRYVPEWARTADEKSIADRWIREFEQGIGQSGIKPGFVKLAFDDGEPSDIDSKLFKAGLLTHLHTGLTLAVHTGNNLEAVNRQLKLLDEYGVSPSAWVWVHANKLDNDEPLLQAAKKGAWISLDGVKETNISDYVERLQVFKQQNLLNRVLLSHDGNSFPRGGSIRPYQGISELLVSALKNNGFTEDELNQLLVTNPANAFTIDIRTKD